MAQTYFRLSYGQSLQPGLHYRARSCRVDNLGWQWVHFPEVGAYVAPFTRGAVIAFDWPSNTPRVDTAPPTGMLVQSPDGVTGVYTAVGQAAELRFSDAASPPVSGQPAPIPTSLTATLTWTQSGVPASDPYSVLASTSLNAAFGLPNIFVDLVTLTAAFQAANLPAGVGTVDIQVGNGPVLALPQSGILQQQFPPGTARVFVPRTPQLSPLLTVQSAGGGTVGLGSANQTIQVQATYQVALT